MRILIFVALLLSIVISRSSDHSVTYTPRELKGTSSEKTTTKKTYTKRTTTTKKRSSYTGSSTSSRQSYNGGVYTYSTYANPIVYTNNYWDAYSRRTSQPLYVYYLPPNYYTT
jgi:hypothetical protein